MGEAGVKMVNIQQQPQRPRMDHMLLKELISGDAYGRLKVLNPGQPAANQVLDRMTDPVGLLQGVTSDGDGVLHIAARSGNVNIVHAISEKWSKAVDVAYTNKRGETALHYAAAAGNVKMISRLISMAPDPVATGNDKRRQLLRMKKLNGETCLHEAVRCGEKEAVKILVEEDVNVSVGPGDSLACWGLLSQPLFFFLELLLTTHTRTMEMIVLIQRIKIKANIALVRIHDNEGVSPLYLATTLRKLEIVQFLTQERNDYPAASYTGPGRRTALHAAVLLSKGLSDHLANWNNKELIDMADESGSTPLHLLASANDKSTMKRFLQLDQSVGYRCDNEGSLPIHIAAARGSREIVRLLSDTRPNCSWSCNNSGQTILHIAVKNGNSDVVDYICSGKRQYTCFQCSGRGCEPSFRTCLRYTDKFARIFNTRDVEGNTALHLAVLQGEQLIFCRLMQKRAICLSITNKMEQTPLDLAQMNLPRGTSLLQSPRHWAMYSLILAGADYGTCRSDHLAPDVGEPEKKKEAEAISKSAGLVAVCSVLILTSAFAAPFSVTIFYKTPMKEITGAIAYRIFVMSDAMAFALSVIAISCATLAGFSFTDRGTGLFYLNAGVGCLFLAALSTILVFTTGVYLAVGSVIDIWSVVAVCLLGVFVQFIILPIAPAFRMLLHAKALYRRLGFGAWFCAMFCLLPRQRRDRVRKRYRAFCAKGFTMLFLIVIFSVGLFVAALESAKRIMQPA